MIIWNHTKKSALAELKEFGFIPGQFEDGRDDDCNEGECGDNGIGSRLYFRLPEGGYNSFGVALVHATADRVEGNEWATSYYGLDI